MNPWNDIFVESIQNYNSLIQEQSFDVSKA